MKKITAGNYKTDKYYRRIVTAVNALLSRGDVVAPVDVFIEMGLLDRQAVVDWRFGRAPYLERVIHCNLAVASRILRILKRHAQDRGLKPSFTAYHRHGRGPKTRLRFSKTGDRGLEEAYSSHFIRGSRTSKKDGSADQVDPVETSN